MIRGLPDAEIDVNEARRHYGLLVADGFRFNRQQERNSTYAWVTSQHGRIPDDAVKVGKDADGGKLYIGRAWHEGDLLPAKVAPRHSGAFVPWGCAEHSKFEYEVLVADSHLVSWVASSNGNVPPQALQIGRTVQGEPLYAGRVAHAGTVTPGKIHPSHGVLYIPWGGKELNFNEYEVLCNNGLGDYSPQINNENTQQRENSQHTQQIFVLSQSKNSTPHY
uniref:Natterin-4 n=1 Tax=Cacopsylla melanoneura TaxID=428564 RepID=A0A8D8V9P8_9HEMI